MSSTFIGEINDKIAVYYDEKATLSFKYIKYNFEKAVFCGEH